MKNKPSFLANIFIPVFLLLCSVVWAGPPDLTEIKRVTAEGNEAYDDAFGESVATADGRWLFVGSPDDDPKGNGSGAVYIYRTSEGGWIYKQTITASDGNTQDKFGYSLSVTPDFPITLAVGARGHDSYSGAVYVFQNTIEGWTERAIVTASDRQPGDLFGESVAIVDDTVDGFTLVVGAPGVDTGETPVTDAGALYVFSGEPGNLNELARLTATDGESTDSLGLSVGISGTWVVTGAPLVDRENPDMGAAYLFKRPVTGWIDATETQKLTAIDTNWGDQFGRSVAIDGNTIAVGAPFVDDLNKPAYDMGAAYIFELNSETWQEQAKLTGSDDSFPHSMGNAVSVSGKLVVAGARTTSSEGGGIDGGYDSDGAVFLFEKPEGAWVSDTQTKRLGISDPANNAQFGAAVHLESGILLAGRPGGLEAGYVFDLLPPIITNLTRTPAFGVQINTLFTINAEASDTGRGENPVIGAEYQLNGGEWISMQGDFGASRVPVSATVDVAGLLVGNHEFCVRAIGQAGVATQSGPSVCEPFAIVLEPDVPDLAVHCQHEPIWPQPGESVEIIATSLEEDAQGYLSSPMSAEQMEIWLNDTASPVTAKRNGAVENLSHTTGPLSSGSFFYGCRATLNGKSVFTGWRRVTVGLPEGEGAIGIAVTGPPSDHVDVVFVADVDSYSGSDDPAFIEQVTLMINTGFFKLGTYNLYQNQLNFWIARNMAEAGRSDDSSGATRTVVPPSDWDDHYAFADVSGIIHSDAFRDFARNGFFTVKAQRPDIVRHETGHSAFGLADEYAGDVSTYEAPTMPNVYETLVACEADAPDLGRTAGDCREFESTHLERSFFTSEPDNNDLMNDNRKPNAADLRRIQWKFEKCVEGKC